MTEFNYYISLTDTQSLNLQVGLSGIVSRVKFSWNSVMSTDAKYLALYIHPSSGTSIGIAASKFYAKVLVNTDAAPTTRNFNILKYVEETNFFVDKSDWILFRNESGSTQLGVITLDITPVGDKTKLALGGAYHNQ